MELGLRSGLLHLPWSTPSTPSPIPPILNSREGGPCHSHRVPGITSMNETPLEHIKSQNHENRKRKKTKTKTVLLFLFSDYNPRDIWGATWKLIKLYWPYQKRAKCSRDEKALLRGPVTMFASTPAFLWQQLRVEAAGEGGRLQMTLDNEDWRVYHGSQCLPV